MRLTFHETPFSVPAFLTVVGVVVFAWQAIPPMAHAISHTFLGIRTEGEFRRIEWVGRSVGRGSRPFVWFSFELPDGQRLVARTPFVAPFIPSTLRPKLPVSYMPDNPRDADIFIAQHVWGLPAIFMTALLVLLAIALRWIRANVCLTFSGK